MREISVTKEVKEVTGYVADDGTYFRSEEECEKYEQTANAVIKARFHKLFVGDSFQECSIFEDFGYGSEEFEMAVIQLNNEDDVKAANMYINITGSNTNKKDGFTSDDVGKRILVGFNDVCGYDCLYTYGTEDELVNHFRNDVDKFFNPERYVKKETENDK